MHIGLVRMANGTGHTPFGTYFTFPAERLDTEINRSIHSHGDVGRYYAKACVGPKLRRD